MPWFLIFFLPTLHFQFDTMIIPHLLASNLTHYCAFSIWYNAHLLASSLIHYFVFSIRISYIILRFQIESHTFTLLCVFNLIQIISHLLAPNLIHCAFFFAVSNLWHLLALPAMTCWIFLGWYCGIVAKRNISCWMWFVISGHALANQVCKNTGARQKANFFLFQFNYLACWFWILWLWFYTGVIGDSLMVSSITIYNKTKSVKIFICIKIFINWADPLPFYLYNKI